MPNRAVFATVRLDFRGILRTEAGRVETTVVLCTAERSAGGCLGVRPDAGTDLARNRPTPAAWPSIRTRRRCRTRTPIRTSGCTFRRFGGCRRLASHRRLPSRRRRSSPRRRCWRCRRPRRFRRPSRTIKPPVVNAPASLSGILSDGEQIEIKPDADKLWDGSFNLGLDGSEGNTEAFNFRFGFNADSQDRVQHPHARIWTIRSRRRRPSPRPTACTLKAAANGSSRRRAGRCSSTRRSNTTSSSRSTSATRRTPASATG